TWIYTLSLHDALPIFEAALIGQNIAPGFNREFASENWEWIHNRYWENAFEEVEDKANYDQKLDITGSDIDHKMIDIAKENATERSEEHTSELQSRFDL